MIRVDIYDAGTKRTQFTFTGLCRKGEVCGTLCTAVLKISKIELCFLSGTFFEILKNRPFIENYLLKTAVIHKEYSEA